MENGKHERKNSGGSDTSSNQGKFGESKSSKGGDVADMQKKMKILKDALVKERQEKEGIVKAKKDLDKELERAKGQLQEKDSFLMRLKDETSDLQAKFQFEMKKNESKKVQDQNKDGLTDMLGSSIAGLSEMFGVTKQKPEASKGPNISQDDLKKLQNDYNQAKKDIETTKEKLLKIGGTVQEATKEANQQTERIQKKLQELQKDLDGRIQAYKDLEQKYEEVCSVTKRLKWDKEGLDEELGKLRKENDSLMNVRDDLEKEHNEKVKIVDELKEVCQKMISELEKQAEKSLKITTQMEDLENNQHVYDTTRTVKGKSTPAQILMRKTITGEYLIEIETPNERIVVNPQSVQTFGLVKESEDQFYFDYKNARGEAQKEIYVSENRKKILKALKTFVRLAEENKVKPTEKKEKGLFGQVVSFFNT